MSPNSLPDVSGTKILDSNDLSKEDIVDLLSAEDEGEVKEDKEIKEDGEEDKEIKLEEEKEIEIDDEVDLVVPPRRQEILKKYPTVFKDFPFLEVAMFKSKQYTELLPTIDDAKEAIDKAETLDKFENDLSNGDIGNILSAAKKNDKAFSKIVDNYLPSLARVDQQAYLHIVGNMMKHTIINMVQEAKSSQNEALQEAAQILNQFVFGTSKFTEPKNLSTQDTEGDKQRTEIQEERAQFMRESFESKRDDLNTKISNVLKSTVDGHIDPKSSMTDYVKKNATRDALDNLDNLIHQDKNFVKTLDKLWEKAFQTRFSEMSIKAIRSAYLSKAKTLLPSVIQKARNDALKGLGKRATDDDKEEQPNRGVVSPGRASTTNRSTKKDEIPKGMSNKDFLMQD